MAIQNDNIQIYFNKYDFMSDMDNLINSDGFQKAQHFNIGEFMGKITDDFCRNSDSIGITYFRIIMRNIIFYAELNGELIGIISFSAYKNKDKNIIKILGLCSPEKYKDYKVGSLLINNVIQIAKQSNINYITLDCTASLFNYYSSFGFSLSHPDQTHEMKLNIMSGGQKIKNKRNKIRGKWSLKYKKSINCSHPKGFSQKQHCKYGRTKTNKKRQTHLYNKLI